ncbi:Tetracycline repressor protein class H [Actinoplanes sp. SE50]|uniref:TetR/AcrR family transcriptional regulator n=1 Tax=unclassified Actinoplanes TaxID=2626549 RepID=UPI00023EC8AC|nr:MULTISPECIES: TetR/AcrR family transcriptional regulator [unclassified Actinoplanes]AEV81469.1 Tetracycline repressor protein class H [Actinoplanes sp. SE50/110]ATO79872.1 Tetracycline repressor protein class H [Actinoplanes sp. SE50]SLL97274.1 Tetracycline repressor protein class H [Actinoplanes sp. SE50/110]
MKTSPWSPLPDKRPARVQLDREQIIDAALRIVDAEGVEAVSTRRVAAEFGTGPSSLYAHVSNKDELLRLMFDRVCGEIDLPTPDPARWAEQIRQMMCQVHEVLLGHNDLARVALASIPNGPNALRCSEWMIGLLIEGGVSPRTAAWALDRIFLYVTTDAYEISIWVTQLRHLELPQDEVEKQVKGEMAKHFEDLPADRFPYLRTHAAAMTSGTSQERFEFGLDLLIDGLTRSVGKG